MPIAPSTFYAARGRRPSRRALRDELVKVEIARVHAGNYGVYGSGKVHVQLRREGVVIDGLPVARCTVRRLMTELGLRGVSRSRTPVTTVRAKGPGDRPDLVKRQFTAGAPDKPRVADITCCRTFAGFVYLAFVLDVCSRRVVGWQIATNMRVDLPLDALNMGLRTRDRDGHDVTALVHHSDRGSQGEFNWSSQHLDHGGSRWDGAGSRCRSRRRVHAGCGQRMGRCGRRCARRAGRSPRVRCSGSSGG